MRKTKDGLVVYLLVLNDFFNILDHNYSNNLRVLVDNNNLTFRYLGLYPSMQLYLTKWNELGTRSTSSPSSRHSISTTTMRFFFRYAKWLVSTILFFIRLVVYIYNSDEAQSRMLHREEERGVVAFAGDLWFTATRRWRRQTSARQYTNHWWGLFLL